MEGKENIVSDETILSVDEERKVLIGQRTVVEEFDVIEIPAQIKGREQLIKHFQGQIDMCKMELDQINKHSKLFEKWEIDRMEEQKKMVVESDKKSKSELKSSSKAHS